jgi:hypothetical protein
MPTKIKQTQKEDLENNQGRDLFQTPNYATDLLIPFLHPRWYIWECAAGGGKIVDRLEHHNFTVFGSEISPNTKYQCINFLLDDPIYQLSLYGKDKFCIITNPPYSLKKKFYLKCKKYEIPFALLIPADYSGWVIDAIRFDGAEKIIPTRRIDFITPTGKSGVTGNSANYHSLWLTWRLNIGKSETFVELTKEMKENI